MTRRAAVATIAVALISLAVWTFPAVQKTYEFLTFASRHEYPHDRRDAFIDQLLVSIRDGTEFHKTYVVDPINIPVVREHLRKPWKEIRWDGPFMDDQCYVVLDDGTGLEMYVGQRERSIVSVNIGSPGRSN